LVAIAVTRGAELADFVRPDADSCACA
jgi:hypothetical protein